MKLNFNHRGVKLFFITFAVAGRAKVLSKLVDEKSRPELTALGEAVKAALLAIHKVNEAVGISDFIIMPDHVHFLMVVDYERDKNVSPLFLSHRVMDAVELAIGRGLVAGKTGVAPRTPPTAETMAALMKEAVRFYNNAERYGYEGSVIHQPKAAAKQALRVVRSPEGSAVFFDRSCYIELSFSPAQLRSIRRYIRLNPARALWKARNPDCFIRRAIPSLDIRRSSAAAHGFRQNCLLMNEIAAALCNR